MVTVGLILCRVHYLLSYLSWLLLASFSVVFTVCLVISHTTDGQRFISAHVTTKIRSIVGTVSLGRLINVIGNVP